MLLPLPFKRVLPCWRSCLVGVALALLPWLAVQAQTQGGPPPGWRLVLQEEFEQPGDSSALASRWQFCYPWGRNLGGYETEYYTGAEVNVRHGQLLLTAHRLPQPRPNPRGPGQPALRYTSGMLFGRHPPPDSLRPAYCPPGTGITYGWFEMRLRLPRSGGSFPAFWLYGAPDELDVVEADPTGMSNNVHLTPHEYWRPVAAEATECQCFFGWPGPELFTNSFHRYALEWLPGQLTFYFDGLPIRRETRFLPLGCAQTVIANLAQWAWAQAPTDTMAIDYLRVYRPDHLPPPVFGAPGNDPRPLIAQPLPRRRVFGADQPLGQQTWLLRQPDSLRLYLTLDDNLNPECASHRLLPTGPGWRGPWVLGPGASQLRVAVPPGPAVAWVLLNWQGRLLQQGSCPAGFWEPPLADLPPGSYWLRLRTATAEGWQRLQVAGSPPVLTPSAAWLGSQP
ncbi:MAG: glycoside hydrolase family 16 protein [Janthinobacterium lividum]